MASGTVAAVAIVVHAAAAADTGAGVVAAAAAVATAGTEEAVAAGLAEEEEEVTIGDEISTPGLVSIFFPLLCILYRVSINFLYIVLLGLVGLCF